MNMDQVRNSYTSDKNYKMPLATLYKRPNTRANVKPGTFLAGRQFLIRTS